MLHRHKSSQYLFHYIAIEIVREWIIPRWLITIYIIVLGCIYRAASPHYIALWHFIARLLICYCVVRHQQSIQHKGDPTYSGATHRGFKVHVAMKGCVVQSISRLSSILKINTKLMNFNLRNTLVRATVPESKDDR